MYFLAQGFAFDIFHRDEGHTLSLANLVDVRDIWMIEGRGGFGFLHEAPHALLVRGNLGGQNLQRYLAIQFCVLREIDFTHPTRAKLGKDFVAIETAAGGDVHEIQFRD